MKAENNAVSDNSELYQITRENAQVLKKKAKYTGPWKLVYRAGGVIKETHHRGTYAQCAAKAKGLKATHGSGLRIEKDI